MSNIHVIKVPDVGEGVAEVELVLWHVQPGTQVVEDQALADVMTDKASVEIPSPVAGRVLALGGAVGQMLAVGAELIRIEVLGAGNASSATPVSVAPARPAQAPERPTASGPGTPAPEPLATAKAQDPGGTRPIASAALRRRAWELGVDLRQVSATGSAGRIMQADLDAYVATHGVRPAGPAAAAPVAAPLAQRHDEQAVPVIGVRRRIAVQMQEAKRRIPHFSYVEELDVTEVEALRLAMNAKWQAQRPRLTLLPLLMRALVLALREFPQINARFDDELGVVTRYGAVHIGIATQTQQGLMVPVVRHAEACDLWTLGSEVSRLAVAARAGRTTRDEMRGSTITISSLGALGGIASTPVINRPEVAIVAVNRIVERPVLRAGAVLARQMMNLSSSFDHRVVDGIDGARFIQAMRVLIETPALLFVE